MPLTITVTDSNPAPPRSHAVIRRVLLADDDAVNRQLAQRMLEARGWEVTAVGDGATALARFAGQPFDLVLLDVEMPGLDGPAVAERIRASEDAAAARVPVVALTAHSRREEHQRCRTAGMDACLKKPFDPAALEAVLAGVEPVAAAAPGERRQDAAEVDWELALDNVAGDRELLARLAASAAREAPRRLAELRAGVAAVAADDVHTAAHGLRGTLRLFGAGPVRELAGRIEALAASDRLGELAALAETLAAALEPVRRQLAAGPPQADADEEV